jgi:hypothetical protein
MEREDSSTAQAGDAKFAASMGLMTDPAAGAETRQLEEAKAASRDAEIQGDLKISSRQR